MDKMPNFVYGLAQTWLQHCYSAFAMTGAILLPNLNLADDISKGILPYQYELNCICVSFMPSVRLRACLLCSL